MMFRGWRGRGMFANVIAMVALFVALGGTVYASTSINGSDINKHSIPGNRLKDNTVTGAQINLSKLGKVPSAATADSATNATNATNAASANAVKEITSFQYAANNGDSGTVVLNDFFGLTLRASCVSGANQGLTVTAASAASGAVISFSSTWSGSTGGTENNSYGSIGTTPLTIYSPTSLTSTTNGSVGVGFAIGEIVYSQPTNGDRVSVNWLYNSNDDGHDCYWAGTVVASP